MSEGSGDKQHAPTERRLRQAAEQGNIRRSADLPKAAAIMLALGLVINSAGGLGNAISGLLASWLSEAGSQSPAVAMGWTNDLIAHVAPILAFIVALSAASTLMSGGWILSLKPLMPDLTKFLPSHGLGQIISANGMTETAKSILKFAVIGGLGAVMIFSHAHDFIALAVAPALDARLILSLCLSVLMVVCMGVIALAAGDVGLQYFLHRQKLRMSDTEMRDEMKEAVGNPHVRQRQRAMARRMARTRQMKRIPEASVIVINPTHFAVAIRYRRGVDVAPIMLAKGVGLLAEEIISRGRGFGIPIVEAPPLARAMYRHGEPGDHVPVALYRACAEVLAYVWRMQLWRSAGGAKPKPPLLHRMPIAPEFLVPESST
ncbi:MAG: flagellar type III secretion system protein FlhB [Acidocella sp.]|nr:flagellar type III secretion system protein FlhB [Acidocella sp.]